MIKCMMSVDGLVKRYGGVIATDHVSLDFISGETHAIIGPNGAGKSTLIAQLSGETFPDAGTIRFAGRDLTRASLAERCRAGIARSYQITSIFPHSTALENVATAVQRLHGHTYRFWKPAIADSAVLDEANALLKDVGLGERGRIEAAHLAHGEQRQLELAMTLACRPQLLLLDEPMAGLGSEESVRMTGLLRRIAQKHTIVMVEHDMQAVFALATRISVLVYGRIVATGSANEIRRNPEVQRAYLGEGASV